MKQYRTITSYVATNLTTGFLYRFKVSAFNFNGEGPMSPEMKTYACIAPEVMSAPVRIDSTQQTLTI